MKNWILAARPKTLLASLSPVLLGLALSFHYQRRLNWIVSILTIMCTMLLQIASNFANDYLDYKRGIDNEDRLGPIRATQAKLITPEKMKLALITALVTAFFFGVYLMIIGGWPIIITGLLSMYFAYGYTGGPFPLSYNALGEVAAFIFFGPVAVLGTFYLQTHYMNFHGFLLGLGAGSISATILAINNLRDIKSDGKSSKKTIALIWGEQFQRKLCLFLILNSSLVLVLNAFIVKNYWGLLGLLIPLLFKNNWKAIYIGPITPNLNLNLAMTAKYFFLYALSISLTLVLL